MPQLSPTVLVVGDANVDLVLRGDVVPRFGQAEQLLDSGELVLGGSASITASGLARLGVATSLVARVGDDAFGRFTTDALLASGVDVAAVEIDPSVPTGISVILSAPGDRAILTVPGTIPSLEPHAVLDALTVSVRHVHFASYFLQPALAAGMPSLLAQLRERKISTSLDTNWDPAESWRGLREVLPHLDFLLPNREELHALARALGAAESSDGAAALFLAELGPRVVVKAGSDGGWSVAAGAPLVTAPGLLVSVVDTTGAGDSFNAGYLAALADGIDDERERLGWATTAGSLSTLGAGGTGAQATRAELTEALDSAFVAGP